MRIARLSIVLATSAIVFAACPSPPVKPSPEPMPEAREPGVTVRYRPGEISEKDAQVFAKRLVEVREAVAKMLNVDPSTSIVPQAEVIVYQDAGWGQDYFLVTHAKILDKPPPVRVQVPCKLPPDETDGEKIAARFRGTVAHEIAEATVLTQVRMLDPYLQWMHDGIAESVSYRVLKQLDAATAKEERDRYIEKWQQAKDKKLRWVDLTGWRQQSEWIVHSDSLFGENKPPLLLNDPAGSLARLAEKRFETQAEIPGQIATIDALTSFLASDWLRRTLPPGTGELDLRHSDGRDRQRSEEKQTQFLCYGAAMSIWLELETAKPGITGEVLSAFIARHPVVLRSDDVAQIVEDIAHVDVRPRLERFTVDRLVKVLQNW